MNIFNNREIATAIWFAVILCFILLKKEIRKTALSLLKTLFQTKMLMLIFLMMFYTFWIVFFLHKVQYWDVSLLKDTIIWFFFAGIVMIFDIAPSVENIDIFKKIIIDSLKVVAIVELIANIYTFPLAVELLLMPFLFFVVGIEIVAKGDEKTESIAKLMSGLQIGIGVIILIYITSRVVSDCKNFISLNTLRDFLGQVPFFL